MPDLDSLLRSVAADGTVILTFANRAYLPILENWLTAMERIGIRDILTVALDEPTRRHLDARGAPCLLLPCGEDLSALWRQRVVLFEDIIARGYDLLHSDADAVWLQDPRADWFGPTAADLVFSQGTQWPTDAYERWGFILCCGLFRLRANDAVRALAAEWRSHVEATGDDQVSLNRLLLARGLDWEPISEPYRLPTPFGVEITCSRQLIRGRAGALSVEVLPQHLFQRVYQPGEPAWVRHCLSGQTATTTRAGLIETGCWVLSADAEPPTDAA